MVRIKKIIYLKLKFVYKNLISRARRKASSSSEKGNSPDEDDDILDMLERSYLSPHVTSTPGNPFAKRLEINRSLQSIEREQRDMLDMMRRSEARRQPLESVAEEEIEEIVIEEEKNPTVGFKQVLLLR